MLHPHHLPASTLILALIIVTVGYAVACAAWPFRLCRRCGGTGRHRSPSGRAWRYCHHCHGTGARLRLGRRAWNYARRLHRDGTR
jgi:hypothetical protein